MVRVTLTAPLLAFFALGASIDTGRDDAPTPFATWEFGISLSTGTGSQLYSCFLVKMYDGKVIGTENISSEAFILQAQGVKPSVANPDGHNRFLEHGINTCLAFEDTIAQEYLYRCDPLEDLWKLRFQEYPLQLTSGQRTGVGWAEKRDAPSPRQLMLLADYGILYTTGLCHGENVFRLLHDMADSSWVVNYRQGY